MNYFLIFSFYLSLFLLGYLMTIRCKLIADIRKRRIYEIDDYLKRNMEIYTTYQDFNDEIKAIYAEKLDKISFNKMVYSFHKWKYEHFYDVKEM